MQTTKTSKGAGDEVGLTTTQDLLKLEQAIKTLRRRFNDALFEVDNKTWDKITKQNDAINGLLISLEICLPDLFEAVNKATRNPGVESYESVFIEVGGLYNLLKDDKKDFKKVGAVV